MKFYTLEEIEDKYIGEKGTPKRDKFDAEVLEWVKSTQTTFSKDLEESVEIYFETNGANKGRTKEDIIERRKIVAKKIVIECLSDLDKSEADKLEKALIQLSTND